MTEITITLPDPAQTVELLHNAARHAGGTGWDHKSAQHTDWLARQITAAIEEQMPKSAIEEPLAFASVVKVKTGTLFVRVGAIEPLPWASGECLRSWDQLDVAEVLRIGVGEASDAPSPELQAEWRSMANKAARRLALDEALLNLNKLRAEAITSERKNAYDVAIKTVEDLQP